MGYCFCKETVSSIVFVFDAIKSFEFPQSCNRKLLLVASIIVYIIAVGEISTFLCSIFFICNNMFAGKICSPTVVIGIIAFLHCKYVTWKLIRENSYKRTLGIWLIKISGNYGIKNMEKVSVILPLYNAEEYVGQTMDSLLGQTYKDFEVIIIDDCPTDSSLKIVETFKDERLRILHNEKNLGVCASRNRGISEASGKYILFMDHDDIAPIDKLEKQVQFLKDNEDIDAVGGRIQNIDSSGTITGTFNPKVLHNPDYIRAVLMFGNIFINSSVLYRTSVIKENRIKFREHSYGLEDWLFLLEVSKKGNISGIDENVLLYRRHANNTEKKILATQQEERSNRYSEIRRFAFESEGFCLNEEQFHLLDKIFVESPCDKKLMLSFTDIGNCGLIFDSLLLQAEKLNLRNKNELRIAFKRYLTGYISFIT